MKQLELTTNKRLLIVELHKESGFEIKKEGIIIKLYGKYQTDIIKGDFTFICKGSDLTEDIAKGFTHSMNFGTDENPDIGYHNSIKDNYWGTSALESFISAIEAKGYHWGGNPYEKELDSCNAYTDMFTIAKRARKYEEAESRTFNPEKTLIFEIL